MPIKFANTYVKSYSYYPKAFRFISMMRYDFDKRSASEKYEIALLTTDEKSDSYEYTYFMVISILMKSQLLISLMNIGINLMI